MAVPTTGAGQWLYYGKVGGCLITDLHGVSRINHQGR
jgi:hypothetical protein